MTGWSLRGDVSSGWLDTDDVARAADVGKHVESRKEEQWQISETESKSGEKSLSPLKFIRDDCFTA